jgi:hypothetical protein
MNATTRRNSLPHNGNLLSSISRRAVGALLVAVLGAACGGGSGDDTTAPNPPGGSVGSFSATVSGAMTASLSGSAAFGSSTVSGSQGFAIALVPASGTNSIIFARVNAQAPGTGTYQIADFATQSSVSGAMIAALIAGSAQSGQIYISTSGTLTITSSSSDEIKGNFTVAASAVTVSGTQTVTLTGTFTARRGAINVPTP